MTYFQKIFRYAGPFKLYIGLNIFFNIFYALFSAISFVAMIPMLNVLFGQTPKVDQPPVYRGISSIKSYLTDSMNYNVSQAVEADPLQALMLSIGLILVLFFLKNLFNYLALFFITFLRNGILKNLRNDIFKKMIELPVAFYSEKKKGDTIARITADVLEIQHSFLSILEVLIREPLTIIFTLIMMFSINTNLSFFVLLFIPFSGLIISRIGKSLKQNSDKVQKEQGNFLSIVEETLGGLTIVKAFFAEERFYQKFTASTQRFFKFNNSLINRQNLASPMSEFLGIGVIGGLLWYEKETKNNGGKLVNPVTGDSRFELTKMDPQLYSQIKDLKEGEISLPLLEADRSGTQKYKILKIVKRYEEHQADYSKDYSKIKELALKDKQLRTIKNWMKEKIEDTYVSVNRSFKPCDFSNNWLKK